MQLVDLGAGEAGGAFDLGPVGGAGGGFVLLVAVGVGGEEVVVEGVGFDEEAAKGAEEGLVAAEPDGQVQVGQRGAAAARPVAVCGFLNRSVPASASGLTVTMRAPPRFAFSRAESIRGWLVPGFWPATMISSARWRSSSRTLPLPTPRVSVRAEPEDSWHMLEQSGRLLVPKARAKSWRRKAASLLVRPEV